MSIYQISHCRVGYADRRLLNSPTDVDCNVYLNLSSTAKLNRAKAINALIGSGGLLRVYSGLPPPSPDYPTTGTLLASLGLPTVAARAVYSIQQVTIKNVGENGSNGPTLVTGTTGTGLRFQVIVQIVGGQIASIQSVASAGAYDLAPNDLTNEPVTGGGLLMASLALVLTGRLVFNPISQGIVTSSGTAGYARMVNASGFGVMDLDVDVAQPSGTANPSVIVNSTNLIIGAPISVLTDVVVEA